MKESLLWGRYTWYLFHILIEKIKEEHVNSEIKNIQNIIYLIVSILPCPVCREHGIKYLNFSKKANKFGNINNKAELKTFIFNFHNIVNKNTNKKQYNISILDQYKNVNLEFVISYWDKYFKLYKIDQYNIKEENIRLKCKKEVLSYFNNIKDKLI